MQAGDLATDREPEARSPVSARRPAVDLLERFEDDALLVLRDADARVLDREGNAAPAACAHPPDRLVGEANGELHLTAARERDGVRHQVPEHLPEAHVVGANAIRNPRLEREVEREPLLGSELAERAGDVVAQL